jgi:hypothetical protein
MEGSDHIGTVARGRAKKKERLGAISKAVLVLSVSI